MGHLLGESIRDLIAALAAHGGPRDALRPGHGPRRHRHPERGREAAPRRGAQTRQRSGARGVPRARCGRWKEQYGGLILKQLRRLRHLARLVARALHARPELLARGAAVLPAALRQGPDLPRATTSSTGARAARPRSPTRRSITSRPRARSGTSRYPIKGTEKFDHRGDDAARDHARRHRGARCTRRTAATRTSIGKTGGAAAGAPRDPDRGRRRRWIPSSAPARSRSRPRTTRTTSRSAQRHDLPTIVVMDERGVMNENAGDFRGLDRFEARERIVEALTRRRLPRRRSSRTRRSVGHCSRCDTVIEPYLSLQWFVQHGAARAHRRSRRRSKGKVEVLPVALEEGATSTGSRTSATGASRASCGGATGSRCGTAARRWWCRSTARRAKAGRRTRTCSTPGSRSWLWPFATLGWPEKTEDLERYYPNSLMVTGSDIIFFWVARMISWPGSSSCGEPPFPHVLFTSIVRDAQGRKMSKSLGNSPDPLAMMDQYGADAVRFTHGVPDAHRAGSDCSTRSASRPASSSRTRCGTPRAS